MSELNFPKNPVAGQEYTFNSLLYMFDGVKWVTKGTGYNPVQDLYEMLASDAGASFVGANGYDNVQAALEAVNTNLQAQIDTKINADFVSRFDREALRRSYAEAGYVLVAGSFEQGGTVATSTDVLLYEAEGKAYSWDGVFPVGGKAIPALSTPATTGGVSDAAWLPCGDVTLRENLAESIIYVRMGQDVWDGVTDNTAAVQAAHTAANLFNASVSYAGITKFAIQANAQVPIKTNVDFCGAEVVILGGVNSPPSFNTFNTAYVISDDACPLQTVTGAVAASNLKTGSLFPTLGLFDGHGFAKLTCGLQVPARDNIATQNYTQSFKVNRNGKASLPLSTDLSAFAAAITVDYRKTSLKRLTIENISLVEGPWNNQRLFKVSRCNVKIDGLTLLFTGGNYDNICAIISIDNASDVTINDYITTGRPVTTTSGSYDLEILGGADIRVNGMNALEGWGCIGTNDINGLYVNDSTINRIDAHSSGHNIFANNCDIHQIGIGYGWGGGLISVKNSRYYRCIPVFSRGDWGGAFFGEIVVDGVEISHNGSASLTVVDLATNPLGASIPVYAPRAIEVSNVKRIGAASSDNGEIIPVLVKIASATSVVYAPYRVSVRDVGCTFARWKFGLRLDILNMEAAAPLLYTRVFVDGVYPDVAATSTAGVLNSGILEYDAIRTPTTPVRAYLEASHVNHLAVKYMGANFVEIRCNDCGINAIDVNTATATKPIVQLDNCRLHFLPSGHTTAIIGASNSGTGNQTVVRNCEIAAAAFDLSLVAALIGNTIRTGATQPTLPATVTPSLAFTGWQKPGVFS